MLHILVLRSRVANSLADAVVVANSLAVAANNCIVFFSTLYISQSTNGAESYPKRWDHTGGVGVMHYLMLAP